MTHCQVNLMPLPLSCSQSDKGGSSESWDAYPHLIAGVDQVDSYEALCRFIHVVAEQGGITHFIIHARKCILKGLSPAQNRTVPPLRYPPLACFQFPRGSRLLSVSTLPESETGKCARYCRSALQILLSRCSVVSNGVGVLSSVAILPNDSSE